MSRATGSILARMENFDLTKEQIQLMAKVIEKQQNEVMF